VPKYLKPTVTVSEPTNPETEKLGETETVEPVNVALVFPDVTVIASAFAGVTTTTTELVSE
jgi:hypothetical protein